MPSDSGEKVTLGLYYGVTIFLVALATAMTVLTLNVHHQGVHGGEVPLLLQRIAFKFLARLLFVRIDPYHSITHHVRYIYQRDRIDSARRSESYKSHQYQTSSPEIRMKHQYNSPTKPRIPLHESPQKARKEFDSELMKNYSKKKYSRKNILDRYDTNQYAYRAPSNI
ncbi:hypothetical protein TELCIR_16973 [Teladorsagia circumcincta]|uniref:Neurotransmitter-gated ion-channel transmembrane domain-containing protein n=1 Tax=Teladorsagia circumcincta TaxID=45464 RepID=A0A2G9TU14_TELCI|nr:hypothetical protein TELCIR_16973 [Teladorsagia circumcincta]